MSGFISLDEVRYCDSSLTCTLHLGRVARAVRRQLSRQDVRAAVGGHYLSSGAILSLAGLLATHETKDAIL